MIYMPSNHASVWKYREQGYSMGWLMSPDGFRRPEKNGEAMPFALDNGLYFPPDQEPKGREAIAAFYEMLGRCVRLGYEPIFVVTPDRPYDAERTRAMAAEHVPVIRGVGYAGPLAIAVQDGMELDDADGFDAIFVGGSTDWKWGTAEKWAAHANQTGRWCHIARVNTIHRVRQCVDMGAHSADGTGIFRGNKTQLAGVLEAVAERHLFFDRPSEQTLLDEWRSRYEGVA